MLDRRLDWEALRNARDLGGLPLVAGGVTRFGSIVRADTVRQLTPAGWDSVVEYGVTTILDLRFREEIEAGEPLDAGPGGLSRAHVSPETDANGKPAGLDTVVVSVLGEADDALAAHFDRISRGQPDASASTRAVYLEMLERFRTRFSAAAAAIADAPGGGVLVHCHAGKDRTGLVVALALACAGVETDEIAADYALSEANISCRLARWIADGADDDEREHRRRVGASPREAMVDVLTELDARYGGAAPYLLGGGLREDQLVALADRLIP